MGIASCAALVGLASAAMAQAPALWSNETKESTATIAAIDRAKRVITLKSEHGRVTMRVKPEVRRFDELKVGDRITFRYQESVLASMSKPGPAAAAPSSSEPTITRGTEARPSATVTQEHRATVTIRTIDEKGLLVTVVDAEGEASSFKLRDRSLIEGFKAGDHVDIVYTEALLVSVK